MKCLQTSIKKTIQISGIPTQDLVAGTEYMFSVNNTNVVAYYWNFLNENILSNNQSVAFKPKTDGCKAFSVKIVLFGGVGVAECVQYFVTSPAKKLRKTRFYQLASENEVINGKNIGGLIFINGIVWMLNDVNTGASFGATIYHECPQYFRFFVKNLQITVIFF